MSVICDESDATILARDGFFVATRDDMQEMWALSAAVVLHIPAFERRPLKARPELGGVDVHAGEGGVPKSTGTLLVGTWGLGKFLFSISHEAAMRYLPTHYGTRYPAPPDN